MFKTLSTTILLTLIVTMLASCGGGSKSSAPANEDAQQSTIEAVTEPVVWLEATPESVGMDSSILEQTFDQAFVDGSYTQAALVIKDNKLIYERYRGILP